MELQRQETPHNTTEQVADYLDQAQAIADAHGVDREREPEVFCKIVDLVAAKQITVVQPQPVGVALGSLPPNFRH